jgi:hypothetical protein
MLQQVWACRMDEGIWDFVFQNIIVVSNRLMQKYFFLLLSFSFFLGLSAQEELDSTTYKEDSRLKDLIWIKDSVYKVFKTRRYTNLKTFYPSFRSYRDFIDTSAAGDQSDITQFAMYNNFWNRIKLQFYKLIKKTDKAGIDWQKTSLDSFYIDSGVAGGNGYVYVHWIVKYNGKKKHHVSALFLQMHEYWFLMDELRYGGVVVEKKKKKSVDAVKKGLKAIE